MPPPDDRPIALTIGTAGHVDHGKTTLVRHMTGTDTDRLEEEHSRGISIVPGYAELELPGGRRASLVDVPGHERFVKNMVAGSTGVDAFLLVVAADDGVMPQTREHLEVLRVLGVGQGVVALTKTDVVDDETVELAELEVVELLEEFGVEAQTLPVSGVTGEGVAGLLDALDELVEGARPERSGVEVSRLPVDRAFVLKGIGVVVTGTLWSGEVKVGEELYTASGIRTRVRDVQNHGRPAEVARAGARTALNLAGAGAQRVRAGDTLLSQPTGESRVLDVRVRLLRGAKPLAHGVRVRLHHGTRDTNARVALLEARELVPGGTSLARLRLEEPLVALAGDRFVLRSMAPQVTIGGGEVVDGRPADPAARRPQTSWLKALESGEVERIAPLYVARNPAEGVTAKELSLFLSANPREVAARLDGISGISKLGEFYASDEIIRRAEDNLLEALDARAKNNPETPELSVAEARTATGLKQRLADALLQDLAASRVRMTDSGVSLPDADEVPPELEEAASRTSEELRSAGAEPPATEPGPALRLLVKRGEAVKIGGDMFASREAAETVLEQIKQECRERGEVSLAGFRDLLQTSRKYAQAWLEYSDAAGVTSRMGDVRVLTRRHR